MTPTLNRCRVACGALGVAFLLAACGSSEGGGAVSGGPGRGRSEPDAQRLDACAMLDKTDVEGAIGEPVDRVEGDTTADGAASCSWYGRDTGSLLQKGVTLIAARDSGKERWSNHKALIGGKARNVADLGDEAFTDGEVIVGYKGNAYVVISPLYSAAGVTLEQIKPLGQRVLERLD